MSDHREHDTRQDPAEALPPELRAAVGALRATPAASEGAAARATAAALAAQREAVAVAGVDARPGRRRVVAWAAAAVAAVGLGAGVWQARATPDGEAARVATATPAASAPAVEVPAVDAPALRPAGGAAPAAPAAGAAGALDEAPRLVRFVLRAPNARRVALVGDFNRWDPAATPLAGRAGVWEADVPLTPGRHAYAFVVDGRGWVLDPAAPAERDPDFGRARSVMVVGLEPLP